MIYDHVSCQEKNKVMKTIKTIKEYDLNGVAWLHSQYQRAARRSFYRNHSSGMCFQLVVEPRDSARAEQETLPCQCARIKKKHPPSVISGGSAPSGGAAPAPCKHPVASQVAARQAEL